MNQYDYDLFIYFLNLDIDNFLETELLLVFNLILHYIWSWRPIDRIPPIQEFQIFN